MPNYTVRSGVVFTRTTTGQSTPAGLAGSAGHKSVQLAANGTSGAFSATANVEGSNDGTNWVVIATITAAGTATTAVSDGASFECAWAFLRGNLTAISGTGASATMTVGELGS